MIIYQTCSSPEDDQRILIETSSCNHQFISDIIATHLRISHGVTANSLHLSFFYQAKLQILQKCLLSLIKELNSSSVLWLDFPQTESNPEVIGSSPTIVFFSCPQIIPCHLHDDIRMHAEIVNGVNMTNLSNFSEYNCIRPEYMNILHPVFLLQYIGLHQKCVCILIDT